MATNIEQIFRDFVMNKIREIEDEGQHTGVIAEGSSNSGVSYSEEKTGSGKEIAVAMESHGDALEHSSSGEVMKRADSGQIEKVAAVVGVTVSKEGAENPHKKTKKHKRHKSKKKKKKRKLEKESSSESALESGAESRAGVKNQGPPGREGAVKEDKAAGVDVSADQQMEEVDGKPKKHKRHGAKKKKKKKKEAKPERKSTSHSRSESCSASGSESELELKPPPVMLPVSSPVVSLEKNQKNTSFGSPPEKSQEKVSLLAVEEVVPMKCEMIVHSCGDNSKAMDIDKMVSSERAAGQVANLSENQPNLPDIISKLEDAHNEEPIKIGSDMPTGAQENQELVNEERCRSCSSSRSMTRLLTQGKTAVPLCTSSQKSPNCSQTPTQILDKPYSQKAHSSSRSTSRRRSSPRKKHSRSLSESRRSRSQSVKRSGRKSRSSSIRKRQYSDSRSSLRNRRSRSRSRHRTKSRSVVRRRRSRSGSRSRHRTVRSRSKRSRSQCNQRSRSTRRGRRFRSRSHSHQRRPLSHSRRSHSTSVRRTKRTRSRSIVIRRRSRSKSAFRRNRWSRSRSFRWKRSKSRSVRRRRSKSRSLWRSRRSKSRSPSRQRRSKTPSSRRSKRSKSRSPARHRCSKSPRGGQKQSERSKQSMSRSLSKTKSKSRSVSGEIESHEKSPFTAEQGISGCPSKEVVTTGMAPTEIHAIGSGTVKREEVSAVSTEVSIQSVDLGGSSVKEETPVDSCGLKLEHAFEEKSIDNANKAASSVGSWRPIPLLVDSSANPQPTFVVESLSSTPLVVVTSTELTDESISLQMNAIEKCTTSQLPPTSQDLLLHSPLHDTSKDNHQNSTTSSVFEDRGKESKFSSRSFSPQSSKPSKSLPLVLKNPLLEISDPVLSTEIKLESDVKCPHEQRSTSPGRHESSETETKPDNSRSCLASKVDEHPLEKRDSEPKCPFSKKENSSKDGQSSVVASPTRSKRSKSRSLSKTKTSQSFARQKRSKSNSSSRRRRSHSLSTSRRKKSKSRSPRRKRSRSWSRSRKKKSKSPTKRRRSRSKSVMKIKKSRSKSTSRTTKRKRSKSRTPVKKKRSNSRSSWRGKRSKSRSMARKKRSKSVEKTRRSKSLSPGRKRRMRSRSTNRNRRSRSRRSRSLSRRRRGGFRSNSFDRRDRWRREPSHSPVVILRKKRSTSHNRRSTSKTPPRLTELDKDQLLEIAKANAAVMCAKVGMPIPESLRPKALPQLSLPNSVSSPLSMSLPLSMNLSMGMSMGMPNITMNAAMATMTAATMTAALTNMGALANMPALPALPTITTKPQPTAMASTANIEEVKRKVTQKANSISIKELTEKCKMIAESKEEMAIAQPHMSDDEEDEKTFGGGALRETKGISFSLSNPSVKPAVRTEAAFAKEFPVSSGSQHRKKENEGAYGEWVPVEKKMEKDKAAAVSVAGTTAEEECKDSDSVFPDTPLQPVDITLAVSERAAAQKRLAENPFDVNAICMLSRAQEQVDAWAQSNSIPGLFTGSTGAQVLSSEELSNSGPQAWIKKDQFLRAAPVSGGVGEFLMRKMGWRVGEGLGKYKEGTVEPIVIDFKTDRKGLVAEGEKMQKSGSLVVMKDLLGKHPVSALMEICNKKKWAPPEFVMVHHSGPDHRKNFLFKVVVNGTDYQPQTASPNKKHAKAMAATVALQAMGEVSGEKVHTGPVFTAATSTG